jgi:heavy metal sensor kinase
MMKPMRRLQRLPIRLRLSLAFAAGLAVVLAATGTFVYLRMRSELTGVVDQGLQNRASDIATLVRDDDEAVRQSGRSPLTERGESLAQVISREGSVFDATPRFRMRALLRGKQLREAGRHTITIERSGLPGIKGSARLLAAPVRSRGRHFVIVVGASLEDRHEALRSLLLILGIGGPVALLFASLVGYGITAAALRPVESMRSEADAVSATEPGRRLPVPPADDEIRRLGETLNEMLGRQEAAFARERSFVSDASHELRTPLAILRTEIELALRRGRTPAELEAALRSAGEETDRLTQLAEDLLVIARSDQGRLPVRPEQLAVADLFETVRERNARRSEESSRPIVVEADEQLELRGDRLRIEQALTNLVENAVRHGRGAIVMSAEEDDGAVELHVRDDGSGFPAAFLPAAFERFTRADPARTRGGAGLGLAIVAAIATAHGGTVGARNRPEGGADVWIRLPAALSAVGGSHLELMKR